MNYSWITNENGILCDRVQPTNKGPEVRDDTKQSHRSMSNFPFLQKDILRKLEYGIAGAVILIQPIILRGITSTTLVGCPVI